MASHADSKDKSNTGKSHPAAVTVSISNYNKFKGRKDVENPSWFKLSNRLLEDPDFYHFSHEELLVWVQILARASQKQTATITLNLEHCERVCRLSPQAVMSAINKLEDLEIVSRVTRTLRRRNADVTPTCRGIEERREEERREEEKREKSGDEKTEQPQSENQSSKKSEYTNPATLFENKYRFALNELFDLYPRPEKKARSLEILAQSIKSDDDRAQWERAIRAYAARCRNEDREQRHILTFPKFAEEWREWADVKLKPVLPPDIVER